jgi:NitT/TauT family transport system substrate-binding protein
MRLTRRLGSILFLVLALVLDRSAGAAEPIKVSVIKSAAYGPIFIAKDKGYFAAEGLDAELVFFEAAPPIATALASGDIDFGNGAASAAFFNLAGQGLLKIIAGSASEAPGFQLMALVASNRAAAAGLKSAKDLGGH